MNFTASFLALLAAAQGIIAFPFGSSDSALAPVPVTKLVCDGDTYQCTANLDFGDGQRVAQWNTAVFHTGLFGAPDHKKFMHERTLAPVPVTKLTCDGNTYQCTANLNFGDGGWVAQWSTGVFHQSFTSQTGTSDGNTYKCTAHLDFGDGNWVAQWGSNVFHANSFVHRSKGQADNWPNNWKVRMRTAASGPLFPP